MLDEDGLRRLVSGDDSGVSDNGDGTLSIDPSAYNALAVGDSEVIVYSYDVSDGSPTCFPARSRTLLMPESRRAIRW